MRNYLTFLLISLISIQASGFDTKAKQAILIDANSHQELFSKEADSQMAPSSMSKLMTVYIVFEKLKEGSLKLDDEFFVSEKAWRQGGSKMFLPIGQKVKVEDLLKGVIIQSGNDACITLAEGIAGDEGEFAALMNQKAKKIGLISSNFKNSNGWPDPDHVMSPRDLAILSQKLINDFPEYYHYFSEREFTYNNITQSNRNELLYRTNTVDGLKTGHTEIGGYGLAASAKNNNRRLIGVVNGLKTTKERTEEMDALLKFGFTNYENLHFGGSSGVVAELPVHNGSKKTIKVGAENGVDITLPKANSRAAIAKIIYNGPIKSEVKKGEKIGYIEVTSNEQVFKNDLYALEDVTKLGFFGRAFRKIKLF